MDKKSIVMEYLSQFPISKTYQHIVAEALNANDNEMSEKVVDQAYRYALLIETNLTETKRGQKSLVRLNKVCSDYDQARKQVVKENER